jgi:hypothetical protein
MGFFKEKINRFIEIIILLITFILIFLICIGMGVGLINMLIDKTTGKINDNFIQFLITLSFAFAGFTFFSLEKYKGNKFMIKLANVCWAFIISGFSFLAFYSILNIPISVSSQYDVLGFLKAYNPLIGIVGVFAFLLGMGALVIYLKLEMDKVSQEEERINKNNEPKINLRKIFKHK